MSFPPKVAEQALLDCARHCCICHKFCGVKIELHHIKPASEGGEDTYENCIPLCLDCHVEVSSYNPKHPKGKKYTESELRGHRDRWYEKVKKSHGATINPDYIELDREVFLQVREILPSTGAIQFVRSHPWGAAFPLGKMDQLYRFLDHCTRPEFEFIDADLKGLRASFAESVERFCAAIGIYTFPLDNRLEWSNVPREWEFAQAERYGKAINELTDSSNEVCAKYDELIRLGRRKLGV
jgi:hypothetical protein